MQVKTMKGEWKNPKIGAIGKEVIHMEDKNNLSITDVLEEENQKT